MSKTFSVATGGLLLTTAVLILVIQASGVEGDPKLLRLLAVGFAAPGCVLLARGFRTPFAPEHRGLLCRKPTPQHLLLGPLLIAASLVTLYLCLWVLPLVPDAVTLTAMVGVLSGVLLTASVQGDACVRCDRLLSSVTVRFPDAHRPIWEQLQVGHATAVIQALGAPAATGTAHFSFHVCLRCRGVAVLRWSNNAVIVFDGADAAAFAALASHPAASQGGHILT